MIDSASYEIFSTRFWGIVPSALHAYKKVLDENLASQLPYLQEAIRPDRPFILSSKSNFSARTYIGDTSYLNFDDLDPEDKIINVVDVRGAILRNSGACAYGSKDHRDIIKRAAEDSHVIGQVILMDSPGGSALAMFDYEEAINYSKGKGKPVLSLINGMAASAGYGGIVASNEIFSVEKHDQIGCIGILSAFYANKNGDINSVNQERYVEVYAEGCPLKNKEERDAAKGDNEGIQKDVNDFCDKFHAMVRKYRPQVTDEQLKGGMFEASDVIGTLIDGQGTLQSCIDRIMELSGTKQAQPSAAGSSPTTNQPAGSGDNGSSATSDSNNQQSQINNENMKEYPKFMAALGLNALVSDKDNGLYLTESMSDAAEAFSANAEKTESTLAAKLQEISQLNTAIEQLKADHAKAVADLTAAHSTEIATLKADHKTALDEVTGNLKNAQELITAKDAEIKELSGATTTAPAPGAGKPLDNTVGGKQEPTAKVEPICKEGLTNAEKAEAHKERMEKLQKQMR